MIVELGLLGASLIGLSLGLFGSGGSIITVPVLVYLFGFEAKTAIASSLLIVAIISLFSMLRASRRRPPNIRVILAIGLPGMLGALVGAYLALFIPVNVQLSVFAALAAAAAYRMARPVDVEREVANVEPRDIKIVMLLGLAIGITTGIVGVGGGFMIVPVLVLFLRIAMVEAVTTSLGIIFLNSAVGFTGYWLNADQSQMQFDYPMLLLIAAVGIGGSLLGGSLIKRLPEPQLRKGFSLMLVAMASLILYQTTI